MWKIICLLMSYVIEAFNYIKKYIKYIVAAFVILTLFDIALIVILVSFKVIGWGGVGTLYINFINSMFLEGCIIFGVGSLLMLLGDKGRYRMEDDRNVMVTVFLLILGIFLLVTSAILTFLQLYLV